MIKKQIKLCHITTDSHMGGTEKIISTLLDKINPEQFTQSLIVLMDSGPLNNYCESLGKKQIALGISSIFEIHKIFKILLYLHKEKPDILMSYLYHSNILTRLIGTILGIKVIICGQRNVDEWRKPIHSWIDRLTSPLCQRIISNTQAAKKRLIQIEKINPQKIDVIPNGVSIPKGIDSTEVDLLKQKFKIDLYDFTILCPASFQIKKGHPFLIKAFQQIISHYPNTHLLLAGEGYEKNKIIQLTEQLKLQHTITFTGFIKPLKNLIHICDCIVLPSLWEGLPNVILEAMAQKKAVIATSVGGIPEIINHEHNGLLVPPNDSNSLANAILRIIDEDKLKNKLKNRAYTTVKENFDEIQMVQSFERIVMKEYDKVHEA